MSVRVGVSAHSTSWSGTTVGVSVRRRLGAEHPGRVDRPVQGRRQHDLDQETRRRRDEAYLHAVLVGEQRHDGHAEGRLDRQTDDRRMLEDVVELTEAVGADADTLVGDREQVVLAGVPAGDRDPALGR